MTLPMPASTPRRAPRLRLMISIAALVALAALAVPESWVAAQAPDETASETADAGETPDDRATSFRSVRGAETEDVPGGMLLIGAYGVIAVLLMLFVIRQQRMIAAGEDRLRELEAQLRAAEGAEGSSPPKGIE